MQSQDPYSVCRARVGVCITINPDTNQPASSQDSANACDQGQKFMTYSQGESPQAAQCYRSLYVDARLGRRNL